MDSRYGRRVASGDLAALRNALLAVHGALLEGDRIEIERFRGRMSAGELLQAAIDDPWFAWLRPISELTVQIDEALAEAASGGEPVPESESERLTEAARDLFAPPKPDTAFGKRYLDALQRHPEVGMAQGALMRVLNA